MKTSIFRLVFLSVLLTTFFARAEGNTLKRNSLLFFDLDDWVEIYVDGKKVGRKAAHYGQLHEEFEFDLNPYLIEGKDQIVEVKLFNSYCPSCDGNEWRLGFEVFQDGESVDYVYEEGNEKADRPKMTFSIKYEWGYI
ncbi:hypothetical protein N7E81_10520 [Reichenbachiella carrageenanivorans]|uniref:Glycosyl hydrolases family 2, sugar binding domain n=1 Tax=Reichenbachiella carrageenanivorans TaxID=2979869 RepID=A0ABY6CV72_9BACT|nr:hypothetical protein [Reichenbachiella carrageenanivorans]UXX77804.1 hypothetical protein N7E81_10520 [Reichenbachiella carrageenanivorans]